MVLGACSGSGITEERDADSQDSARSCADLADGESCGEGRLCLEGQCILSTCGDGVLDPGEECDDGNLILGDGCEIDCTFSCHHDDECLDEDLCTVGERCVEVPSGRRCLAGERVECPPEDANPCLSYLCDPGAAELGYCRSEALTGCYPDEDRDGFPLLDESRRVDPEGASCSCPEIGGLRYIHPRTDGRWDCDDTNALHFPGAPACFKDADADGYPRAGEISLMHEDCSCDDSFIPKRQDDEWDCNDENPHIHPAATCLFDRDGDGYPSSDEAAAMNSACECPESDAMAVREDGASDCDDDDPDVHPSAPCFNDADGDGYLSAEPFGSMSELCECPSGMFPRAGNRATDCDDTNDDVRPNQTQYFTTAYCPGLGKGASCSSNDQSFDYNCDGYEIRGRVCPGGCCTMIDSSCFGNIFPEWENPNTACGDFGYIRECSWDCVKGPRISRQMVCN